MNSLDSPYCRRQELLKDTIFKDCTVNANLPVPSGIIGAVGGYFESMIQIVDCFRKISAARNSVNLIAQEFKNRSVLQDTSQAEFLSNLQALDKHIIKSMTFKGILGLSAIVFTIGTIACAALRKNKAALIPGMGILATMVIAGYNQTWNGTWNNHYIKEIPEPTLNALRSNNAVIVNLKNTYKIEQ